ncbi:hypothetical protein [Paenibacillus cellulosilyticus]|uniref:hypothetical protein n=1 Tax=Paenibacillus cellulosilyticus TaxID=375489 RepID=UPI001FEF8FE1|nr:hypothetical protein [Paenibacillus cellulosilyticus]
MDKRVFVFDETNIVNRNSYHSLDLQSYTHLRGYHACRPNLIESYLEKGIVPINENDALNHALYLLQDEGINEKKIIQVFTSHWSSLIESQKCVLAFTDKKSAS